MMKKLFILACVCLLITSCNSNSKNTNDSATSTETTDMHNAENSLDYDGTYTGTFPAEYRMKDEAQVEMVYC